MPRNVAPSGLPSCRRVWLFGSSVPGVERDELRRKSCVTAMPIEAKARDVRSHARNVRSV